MCVAFTHGQYTDTDNTHTLTRSAPQNHVFGPLEEAKRTHADEGTQTQDRGAGILFWTHISKLSTKRNVFIFCFLLFQRSVCVIALSEESGRGKRKSPACYWVCSIVSSDWSCRISENNVSSQITVNELVWIFTSAFCKKTGFMATFSSSNGSKCFLM